MYVYVPHTGSSTENTQSTPTDDIFPLEWLNKTGLRKDVFPETDNWKRLSNFFSNHNPVAQQVVKNNLLCTLLLHREGTRFLIENSKMYYKVHTNTSDKLGVHNMTINITYPLLLLKNVAYPWQTLPKNLSQILWRNTPLPTVELSMCD